MTKARLRQFQSMPTSSAFADCSVAMAMVSLAQRWCDSSTHVSMLGTNELHLPELLDATPPQTAHLFHELRRLGYKMAVGWVVRPPAAGDETIHDAYMRDAGITGRTEAAIAQLQRWRRGHNVMWASEPFRADGITLCSRFDTNLAARARRCESDAIRLCNIAFGRGRGPGNQGAVDHGWGRPPRSMGRCRRWQLRLARRELGRVRAKGHAGATVAVFAAGATPRRRTAEPPGRT